MAESHHCPDSIRLKHFLDGNLTEQEQEVLNVHLEKCARCRQTLDGLIAGKDSWADVARHLNSAKSEIEPAAAPEKNACPTLSTATEPMGDSAVCLDFLQPSDKADSLGRLSHYEVLEVIGRGGMGIVLRAFDESLRRVVAIKVMAPQLAATSPPRKRFLREARAAAAVGHEHVVAIHAVEEQPLPYLVMEYVPGETLQQKLDRVGPLEVPEVLHLGQQIARGLAAAHAQGLIHRDIKPSNILLESGIDQHVKITDFGLARAADDASLTQSGVIAGTPMYMAPEQTQGEATDQRADLFSFGSVLYTMCSGRPPFRASTSLAVLKRVAEDKPRPIQEIIPEVPQWLCDIIARLHAKKPADRFQSAKEVADLLGRCLAELQQPSIVEPVAAPVVGQVANLPADPKAGWQPAPRHRRWAVAAAVLGLLLGGLSLTEATGVTNLVPTVIRIFTPEGTLVVEVDDPGVKVTIEGDGGIVITGAGPQEVRLKPGSYKVRATKDGKQVRAEELVTITRGGKQVVKVSLEGEAATAKATTKAEPGAFVLMGPNRETERKFDTLAEAVAQARGIDTIEIRGNGPFVTDSIDLGARELTIRAGPGYLPVIQANQATVKSGAPLLKTQGTLTLEGLDLRHKTDPDTPASPFSPLIYSESAPLYLTHCKLIVSRKDGSGAPIQTWNSSGGQIRNCLLVSPGYGAMLYGPPGMHWKVDNSLVIAESAFFLQPNLETASAIKLRLTRSTVVGQIGVILSSGAALAGRIPETAGKPIVPALVEVEETVCQTGSLFCLAAEGAKDSGPTLEERPRLIPKLLRWREHGNVYGTENRLFLRLRHYEPGILKNLAEWNQYWGLKDTGSLQGPVLLRGHPQGLLTAPEGITPDDFRLAEGSAGYRAGKDKKDLGADVDQVGPGKAYERWKKTPAYQQWIKETGQLKAITEPMTEAGAFVVMGAMGLAERKFDTLAEAVVAASDGDTIEIRGKGPFVTEPLNLGRQALVIRAAKGFRPVLTLNEKGAQARAALIATQAALVLEGLEFLVPHPTPQSPDPRAGVFLSTGQAPLHIANCRFSAKIRGYSDCIGSNASITVVRNCEFLNAATVSISVTPRSRTRCLIDNCVPAGVHILAIHDHGHSEDAELRLTHNTLISPANSVIYCAHIGAPAKEAVKPLRLEALGNIFDAQQIFHIYPSLGDDKLRQPAEAEAATRRALAWQDRENLYAVTDFITWHDKGPLHGPKSLADWKKFWGHPDADAREGRPRYHGGNLAARLAAAPEKLTPEDFRLRPDSAGYKGGKDGKDLGADVDLVGPGPAYERWQKTPAYQQWLKDTGQVK